MATVEMTTSKIFTSSLVYKSLQPGDGSKNFILPAIAMNGWFFHQLADFLQILALGGNFRASRRRRPRSRFVFLFAVKSDLSDLEQTSALLNLLGKPPHE
jgi:hypothetical protein